jgi:hypothetical protein
MNPSNSKFFLDALKEKHEEIKLEIKYLVRNSNSELVKE